MLRAEANTATLAHLICNVAGFKNEQGGPMKCLDFMPWLIDEEEEGTVEDLARALGAKI